MWQKCHVCLGTGVDNNIIIFNKEIKCTACDGKKIINTITGNPPNINEKVQHIAMCTQKIYQKIE